jgi:ParB/RepB/Spo0J family partition protein
MSQKKRIEEIAKSRTNLFSFTWRQAEPAKIDIANESGIGTRATKLNTRVDFGNIPEFAMSLIDENEKGAIREPLLGFMGANGKFQITNGERRWLGAKWLDEEKGIKILLPCVREPQHYTPAERNLDLLRTNNGKPLGMLEKAHAIKRLRDGGMEAEEIARRAGCSETHVADCLILLSAAPAVQEAVAAEVIAPTLAVDLARAVNDPEKQTEILNKGIEDVQAAAANKPPPKNGKPRKTKITAKHLPVATGKKAQAKKKAETGKRKPESKDALETLLNSVRRVDCDDPSRYDTLEFLIEYAKGRKPLATATKFILGGF